MRIHVHDTRYVFNIQRQHLQPTCGNCYGVLFVEEHLLDATTEVAASVLEGPENLLFGVSFSNPNGP